MNISDFKNFAINKIKQLKVISSIQRQSLRMTEEEELSLSPDENDLMIDEEGDVGDGAMEVDDALLDEDDDSAKATAVPMVQEAESRESVGGSSQSPLKKKRGRKPLGKTRQHKRSGVGCGVGDLFGETLDDVAEVISMKNPNREKKPGLRGSGGAVGGGGGTKGKKSSPAAELVQKRKPNVNDPRLKPVTVPRVEKIVVNSKSSETKDPHGHRAL